MSRPKYLEAADAAMANLTNSASADPGATTPRLQLDTAAMLDGLRRHQVSLTLHIDEEGRTWPQLVQEQGLPIPLELTRAACARWQTVLTALDGEGGPPME